MNRRHNQTEPKSLDLFTNHRIQTRQKSVVRRHFVVFKLTVHDTNRLWSFYPQPQHLTSGFQPLAKGLTHKWKSCRLFCCARGYSEVRFFVENESGAKVTRPQLEAMMNDARAGAVGSCGRLQAGSDWPVINLSSANPR